MASLAFLLNSAALLVFGEDVFDLLSLDELFNPREVFPVKESVNEVNTYRKPREGKLSLSCMLGKATTFFCFLFECTLLLHGFKNLISALLCL